MSMKHPPLATSKVALLKWPILTLWPGTAHFSPWSGTCAHTNIFYSSDKFYPHLFYFFFFFTKCWRSSSRRPELWLICELEPGNRRLLSPLLSLECAFSAPKSCLKHIALRQWCVLGTLCMWLSPSKASIQTLKIWQVVTEIHSCCSTQDNLLCKSPCLLNLPPTILKGPESFFGLSLPFVMGPTYWFH